MEKNCKLSTWTFCWWKIKHQTIFKFVHPTISRSQTSKIKLKSKVCKFNYAFFPELWSDILHTKVWFGNKFTSHIIFFLSECSNGKKFLYFCKVDFILWAQRKLGLIKIDSTFIGSLVNMPAFSNQNLNVNSFNRGRILEVT